MGLEIGPKRRSTGAVLLVACGVALLLAAHAQAQEPQELPPIVVEGATLAAPKKKTKPAPSAASQSTPAQAPAPDEAEQAGETSVPGTDAASPAEATTGETTDGIAIDRLGSAISVVTGRELRARQIRYAADALRSLPGVSVNRTGSFGGLTQVRIRGAEGNHTLVLIDGIEANDSTNGEFFFEDLSAENIERIEVIRGPQSSLYGSGAIGGVINIVTRGGRGPLTISGRADGGSFETRGGAARISGGNDDVYGAVSIEKIKTDGFNISPFGNEEDASELSTLAIKGGATLLEGVTIDFSLRHVDKFGERDTDGAVPGQLFFVQVDDPAEFDANIWLGGVNLRWDMLDGALTHHFKATSNVTERGDRSSFGISQNDGETVRYGYDGTARFETPGLPSFRHTLTGLVEKEEESFTPSSDFVERTRARVSTAAEWRGEAADQLFLTAGARHDDSDTLEDFTTWRTTATLRLPSWGLRPHASAGTGVKFPTLFEQFGFVPGIFTPNPNLKPEKSLGWDAGVEFSFASRRFVLDVTYFEANLTNRINPFVFDPSLPPDRPFTAVNVPGESKRDGVEVAAVFKVFPGLSISGAYTYLMAEDANGLTETRRPRHSGRAELDWAFAKGRGTFNLAAIYNGHAEDVAFRVPFFIPDQVTLDEYWLLTAAASYEVSPGVELFGRVENLLDQDYQEVFGFETAGAAAYAGVRFRYEERGSGSGPHEP